MLFRMHQGMPLQQFPGNTWNTDQDVIERVMLGEFDNPQPADSKASYRTYVPIVVRNSTTAQRSTGDVVSLLEPAISFESDAVFAGIQMKCGEVATDKSWAVLQEPIGPNDASPMAAVQGACWARVNVLDEDHDTCGVMAGNYNLQTGQSGADIIWKESGLGLKWAAILITGNDLDFALYAGTAKADIAIGSTNGVANNVTTISGVPIGGTNELDDIHYLEPLTNGSTLSTGDGFLIIESAGTRRAVPMGSPPNCAQIRSIFAVPSGPLPTGVLARIPAFGETDCHVRELKECPEPSPAASYTFDTRTELEAVDPTTLMSSTDGKVTNDPTPSNNGSYMVIGPVGSPGTAWQKVGGAS